MEIKKSPSILAVIFLCLRMVLLIKIKYNKKFSILLQEVENELNIKKTIDFTKII